MGRFYKIFREKAYFLAQIYIFQIYSVEAIVKNAKVETAHKAQVCSYDYINENWFLKGKGSKVAIGRSDKYSCVAMLGVASILGSNQA
jgi:hypothetical protein